MMILHPFLDKKEADSEKCSVISALETNSPFWPHQGPIVCLIKIFTRLF